MLLRLVKLAKQSKESQKQRVRFAKRLKAGLPRERKKEESLESRQS
jgi:hypothetical protein